MKALVIAPQPFLSLAEHRSARTPVTAHLGVQIDLLTYGQGQDVGQS